MRITILNVKVMGPEGSRHLEWKEVQGLGEELGCARPPPSPHPHGSPPPSNKEGHLSLLPLTLPCSLLSLPTTPRK